MVAPPAPEASATASAVSRRANRGDLSPSAPKAPPPRLGTPENLSSPSASRRIAGAKSTGSVPRRPRSTAHVELKPFLVALHAPEDANRVAFCRSCASSRSTSLPDSALDPTARIDELDRQVIRAAARPQTALASDRVDSFDDPVLCQPSNGAHGTSPGPNTDGTLPPRGRRQALSRCALRRAQGRPAGHAGRPSL